MTPLALSALTDLVLACETFFLTGLLVARPKARFSAAWFWQAALFMLATSALLGGLDHGFVEPLGQPAYHQGMQRATWLVLGLLTCMVFLTASRQFFRPSLFRLAFLVAGVQFAVYIPVMLFVHRFAVVVVNYAPVMLLLLALSIAGLRSGKGSWSMVAGLLIVFAASTVQALGVNALTPLDRNSLYHLGIMLGVVFLYRGGLRLDGIAPVS